MQWKKYHFEKFSSLKNVAFCFCRTLQITPAVFQICLKTLNWILRKQACCGAQSLVKYMEPWTIWLFLNYTVQHLHMEKISSKGHPKHTTPTLDHHPTEKNILQTGLLSNRIQGLLGTRVVCFSLCNMNSLMYSHCS